MIGLFSVLHEIADHYKRIEFPDLFYLLHGRRGGIMVGTIDSGSSCQGSNPGQGTELSP